MTTPTWKLLSLQPMQQTQVVFREWPDGRQESCLVTATDYLKWLSEGNTPEPAGNTSEPQLPPLDNVTFETIELDANKEYLLLKVACGLVGAPVMLAVTDGMGHEQFTEGVIDDTGHFSYSASLDNIKDGPLDLVVLINYGEVQTQVTYELFKGV